MDASFWHQRWETNQIGFHEASANALLVKHLPSLHLNTQSRVFIPLCGKTLDIHWLLSQGFRVVGAELSELAITQLFAELGLTPEIVHLGKLKHYRASQIDIFVGDIFDLTADLLGEVDAIYDRAALVALPAPLRESYSAHLVSISQAAPQLLICYVYEQSQLSGPPFSVDDAEVKHHYQAHYALQLLESAEVAGGFRGRIPAQEHVWQLNRRTPQAR
jgi:thiopurine S-methyltransferase